MIPHIRQHEPYVDSFDFALGNAVTIVAVALIAAWIWALAAIVHMLVTL